MSQTPEQQPVSEGRLDVVDAVRMGWEVLTADFWPVFLVGLVTVAIAKGIEFIPCIACLGPVAQVFVMPPMMAGLFWVVARRIDGARADVGPVFNGFRDRYWPSVVAMLPVTLTRVAIGILFFALNLGSQFALVAVMEQGGGPRNPVEAFGPSLLGVGFGMLQSAIAGIVNLLFMFALVAVWDHPESGWEAARASLRLVGDHIGATLGFGAVFGLLWLGALLGVLACCVGWFFTMGVFQVWHAASTVYLYRSWTGQPLVQPIAEREAAGPVAPGAAEPAVAPGASAAGPPGGLGTWPKPEGPIPPTDVETPGDE